MGLKFRFIAIILAVIICFCGSFVSGQESAAPVLVKYDSNITFQTIEGFGGFGFRNINSADPATWWTDSWGDMVLNGLGLTLTRNEWYPPSIEGEEQPVNWVEQKQSVEKFHGMARIFGKPLRQIISIYSPPAYMKDNKSANNGGRLLPEYYDDFGNWALECITSYQNAGVAVYGVSLQNQPSVKLSYFNNTCVYTPAEYAAMVKIVAPMIKSVYPGMKIIGPEEMIWETCNWTTSYGKALLNDPEALKWIDILAVHSYTHSWQFGPSDPKTEAMQMKQVYQKYRAAGKPIWTTEYLPWNTHWLGGMLIAESIYNSFYYGNTSAWMTRMISGDPSEAYVEFFSITSLEEKGPKYYALRQFSKYIRPGAVRIETSSANSDLLAIAFKHELEKSFTLILINKSRNPLQVKLSGNLKITLNMERSSMNEQAVNTGTTLSNNPKLSLPPESITTLYSSKGLYASK
ncbi:MAG TPA: glycoside hydrolase family 30 beta sandwich domain-containing protein [Bacillota bacterium]|nr:glycoside hydrolase family 30 beta sandwich domain-containing protein [Bacillota bacterium]